jgi:predicted Zn-ribbon and HTH transcriptional regulator
MSQEEIIKLLEDQKRPLSISEIIGFLKEEYNASSITHSVQGLVKWKEVKFIELDRIKARAVLGQSKLCRRARFYYVGNFKVFPKAKVCSGKG